MVDFAVVPERTALVNIDMQNCFVEGSPISALHGLAVLDRINRFTRCAARRHSGHPYQPCAAARWVEHGRSV